MKEPTDCPKREYDTKLRKGAEPPKDRKKGEEKRIMNGKKKALVSQRYYKIDNGL